MTGYLHETYSQSLAEFGTPRYLPESKSCILERPIPGTDSRDAMGCYPLFCCEDWSGLESDINSLSNELVSLAVVTDPFGNYDEALLSNCFRDKVQPFKEHYVADLSREVTSFVHPHHQRNARKGELEFEVKQIAEPLSCLNEWNNLYQQLISRHGITGISGFSENSFAAQFNVPGLVLFSATREATTDGMLLWYVQNGVAYYHLGAYSERGYDLGASFALFMNAIRYFQNQGLKWLNLGGAAGIGEASSQGLARFKKGWSTGVRMAYFCGRIIDPAAYERLTRDKAAADTKYFPAYRAGEFR